MPCQQDQLYHAQDRAVQGRSFSTVKEVQRYVDSLRDADWWERNFPTVGRIEVVKWQRGVADGAGVDPNGTGIIPWHPAWHELIVLHEVTHVLVDLRFGRNGHGPWFARVFLEAVYTYMGSEAYASLIDAFKWHAVDHNTDNMNPAGRQV